MMDSLSNAIFLIMNLIAGLLKIFITQEFTYISFFIIGIYLLVIALINNKLLTTFLLSVVMIFLWNHIGELKQITMSIKSNALSIILVSIIFFELLFHIFSKAIFCYHEKTKLSENKQDKIQTLFILLKNQLKTFCNHDTNIKICSYCNIIIGCLLLAFVFCLYSLYINKSEERDKTDLYISIINSTSNYLCEYRGYLNKKHKKPSSIILQEQDINKEKNSKIINKYKEILTADYKNLADLNKGYFNLEKLLEIMKIENNFSNNLDNINIDIDKINCSK